MYTWKRTALVLLILTAAVFIADKRIFNKDLLIRPFAVGWSNLRYVRDMKPMRDIVIKAKPEILDKDMSDFERVNRIREWVNEQVVWSPRPVDGRLRIEINKKTALEMYRIFNKNKNWFDCGTYSVFLLKVYELFGYESYVLDIGKDNQFKHSVVLVSIKDGAEFKFAVEDPYYNLTYVSAHSTPFDVMELARLIKEKPDEIIIKKSKGKGHKTLCFPGDKCNVSGKKIEHMYPGKTVIFRDRFDTEKIEAGLPSFLHCSNLLYYEGIQSIIPVQKEVEAIFFKKKISTTVELAPKCIITWPRI